MRLRAARLLTDFDSSVNMVRALGRFLRGRDHGGLSVGPASPRLAEALAALPSAGRRRVFNAIGYTQGVPLDRIRQIRADDLAQWVLAHYPARSYPAVVIGAASGAALHLAAALRAPYLPQTLLVAARDVRTHPDDPQSAMHALAPISRAVAHANSELAVYHMHDPAQDRPMLERMAYLRLKRLRLGRPYERFLEERLAPEATIIQLEVTRTWGTRAVGDRAYFQFGALGGLEEDEYHDGSPRIADYLAREGSPRRRWDPPEPDGRRPEAEWGFDPEISSDIARVAGRCGHRLRRLVVAEPEDLSPLVADLYRWWYRRRGLSGNRLLVESYVQWDPLWMLRLGAVPFWLRFNMTPDHKALRHYLDSTERYHEIHLNLFSQGLWSPGVVPLEEWHTLIATRAARHASFIGVDTGTYPTDPGSAMRFQPAFAALPSRQSLPPPLPATDLDEFLTEAAVTHPAQWTWEGCATAATGSLTGGGISRRDGFGLA